MLVNKLTNGGGNVVDRFDTSEDTAPMDSGTPVFVLLTWAGLDKDAERAEVHVRSTEPLAVAVAMALYDTETAAEDVFLDEIERRAARERNERSLRAGRKVTAGALRMRLHKRVM